MSTNNAQPGGDEEISREEAEEIIDEAESEDPRYLVISGRRRSPTGKALFGSTTQQVLLNVDCPVVTQMDDQ